MRIEKPTGRYAEPMLDPDAWPEVDEDTFYDRAQEYTRVLWQVTRVLKTCQHEHDEIFFGGIWSGGAARAARGELGTSIAELMTLQQGLARAITWHQGVAELIVRAKSEITDNVDSAHKRLDDLEKDSGLTTTERTRAINVLVCGTYVANAGVVTETAEQILASKDAAPPSDALPNLLDGKAAPAEDDEAPVDAPTRPASVAPVPASQAALSPSAWAPGVSPRLTPKLSPVPGQPLVFPAGGPAAAVLGATGVGPTTPQGPATPLAYRALKTQAPASVRPASVDAPPAPAEQTDMPAGAMAPAAPMTPVASGGAAGAGSGSRAPVGQPSGSPSGMRPAAATQAAARRGSAAREESTDRAQAPDVAAAQLIPVSPARAARDSIADASAGNAARDAGSDRLRVARHIAAALNAPVAGRTRDLGFFWVTAVTTDGAIVVANSYGLAYIPDGVRLPEQVHMATADEAIPAAERARWAIYPVLAVQGWASHHNTELRAVIGTEKQLADSDAGVAQVVLQADDIPASGEMVGRTRLAVVDPKAADRLAATRDQGLTDLLPPAPAGNPPADQRAKLWLAVMQPLASRLDGRQTAHLRAMHAYAAHTQEVVLHQAHTTVDPVAQRGTVADWLYWKHLTGQLEAVPADAP